MNLTLMRAFWRERFTSPLRLAILLAVWGLPTLLTFLPRPIPMPHSETTFFVVVVLGAGVIGRDISTGVLQLILARPVARSEYVLSRWLGLATAGFAVALVSWAVVLPFSLATGGTSVADALIVLGENVFVAFGLAAVLTGLSAVLPGFGDVALFLAGLVASTTLMGFGTLARSPWVMRVEHVLFDTLLPHVSLKALYSGGTPHFMPLVSWASTVTLVLLVGIVALNRRELSYATAG